MPLGASITRGEPADPNDPDKNGYRKFLRERLRLDGWEVNMVGSYSSWGNMADSDNEGWPGFWVDGVREKASSSVPRYQPNLILINVGTNDGQGGGEGQAPVDMERLLDECFQDSRGTVVLLSTLLPNANAPQAIKRINQRYREIISRRQSEGQKILLAEMDDGFLTINDIWDGIHPTVLGAKKMAAVWYDSIRKAETRGWLQRPNQVDFDDGSQSRGSQDPEMLSLGASSYTCAKSRSSGASDPRGSPQILYAGDSVIQDDGTYTHASQARDSIYTSSDGGNFNYFFAQLFSNQANSASKLDEIVRMGDSSNTAEMAVNRGNGAFDSFVKIDVGFDCETRGVRWGDVNNDGLEDFICITPDGELLVSLNRGHPGTTPTFEHIGVYKQRPSSEYKQEDVRLGDIDGDGRLDYCVIGSNDGHIRCWRNAGIGDRATEWQDMGRGSPVFYAKGMGDTRGVRFADLNGDGRADWTWTSTTGKVTTYINQRDAGTGMVPYWREAGVTHAGQWEETGDSRDNIQFANIYGSPRADYVYVKKAGSGVELKVWENQGSGGKFQKGDGARWGDLRNRGIDDYIWISPEGVVNVFPNLNTRSDISRLVGGSGKPLWGAGMHSVLETGMSRRALHIADWDGDGRADVIGVNNDDFSVTVWKNNWNGNSFDFQRQQIEGGPFCTIKRGLGYDDQSVHVVDISGEGKADLICMERNGRATAWLNDNNSNMRFVGQIKSSPNLERADFQFADVNGDGRADLIHTDKFTGNGRVWTNSGEKDESQRGRLQGSKFEWKDNGVLYSGWTRGQNEQFPSLQGQGRADLVKINPKTGHGWISFNSCPTGGGGGGVDHVGDGGPVVDPGLPHYPPGGGS